MGHKLEAAGTSDTNEGSPDTHLVSEAQALFEAYRRSFLAVWSEFTHLDLETLQRISADNKDLAIETQADWANSAVQLPPAFSAFLAQVYPSAPFFAASIKLTPSDISVVLKQSTPAENNPQGKLLIPPQDGNPEIEILPFILFREGVCSFHERAQGMFRARDGSTADRISTGRLPLTLEGMRDLPKLPDLVGKHYYGHVSIYKVEQVVFERDYFYGRPYN